MTYKYFLLDALTGGKIDDFLFNIILSCLTIKIFVLIHHNNICNRPEYSAVPQLWFCFQA